MVRRVFVQLLLLLCGFVAWSLVLVASCMAQETAGLGIFDATADWGLGLSITKELVELHEGILTVHIQQNIGTTFELSLPQEVSLNE